MTRLKDHLLDNMSYLNKDCFILDLDGTVYLGEQPIRGAIDFIQRHRRDCEFYYLSNNTSKGPQTYLEKLNKMGIEVELKNILSPTTPLVDYLRTNQLLRAYLVGNRDYTQALQTAMPELELAQDKVQAVILAYDTELTYEKLAVSAHLLQDKNVLFLATHPDLVCPDPKGPLPDVGSFLALYEKATGRQPNKIFGKPDPMILSPLMKKFSSNKMVMVGDRLSTDKKLAENAGLDFVLVLSGETQLSDLNQEIIPPWKIAIDLGQL